MRSDDEEDCMKKEEELIRRVGLCGVNVKRVGKVYAFSLFHQFHFPEKEKKEDERTKERKKEGEAS